MAAKLKHLDEARQGAVAAMKVLLAASPVIRAAAIVDDLYGRVSVTIWPDSRAAGERAAVEVAARLAEECGQYFSGKVEMAEGADPETEQNIFLRTAWQEGTEIDGRLRLNDRHRNHTSWFVGVGDAASEQCWRRDEGPAVIAFHGFKGGAGRTTLLAGYALACARRKQRVAVVDMDLDAPGVGRLLGADAEGAAARWGTVDYLIEAAHELSLADYFHVCAREQVTGDGRVEVFPAGALDDGYLSKLARVDLDVRGGVRGHPLGRLLERIRQERQPDVILLDGRAGLSPAAGLLLSGIAHLHVLVASSNVQSLQGLERVVRHLGYEQARRELPQRECIVVQSHVPENAQVAQSARAHFASRAESIFREGYYTRETTEDDRTWSLQDLDSDAAPHVPVPISYRAAFAHFESIDEIAGTLVSDPEQAELHRRIDERLAKGRADSSDPQEEGAEDV